jgi:uncharacterized membrane protein YsdA (DUF1294 family)/cold shock CspA family protein
MRQAGRISEWNDQKGFGFVAPHGGGPRAFVHVKAFQVSARRPAEGDLISYDVETDAKGRRNAINARFAGQRILTPAAAPARRAPRKPPMRIPRLAIGVSFLVAVVALMATGTLPAALGLAYLLMSVASYLMYAFDKEVAGKARWRRTPESTLHLLDLLGGWPGGLIAQHVARHKTVKASFQRGFWVTVVMNLVAFAVLWRSGIAATWTAWLLG